MAGSSRKNRGNGDKRDKRNKRARKQVRREELSSTDHDADQPDQPTEEEEQEQQEEEPGMEANFLAIDPVSGLPILHPRGLWFQAQGPVVRSCTKACKKKMPVAVNCWSQASSELRDDWFEIFSKFYVWDPSLNYAVRSKFNETCQRRLKDNMHKVRVSKKEPKFMQGPVFENFTKYGETPEFQKRSKQAKLNKRRGVEDGPCEATHFGGSMSNLERANRMTDNAKGKLPTAPVIFLDTHGKIGPDGTRVLQLARDKEVYEKYEDLRREAEEENPGKVNDNEVWFRATQPHNRGNVFGMGSAQGLLYDTQPHMRSRDKSNTYVPGPYSRLEMEIEAEKKKNNELYAWMEAQKKKRSVMRHKRRRKRSVMRERRKCKMRLT